MPVLVPLSVSRELTRERSSDTDVNLITITDASVGYTGRFSSHPTQRLDLFPPTYGTISNSETFLYEAMGTLLPSDREGAPLTTTLVLQNVDMDRASEVRSLTSAARVTIRAVMASNPDVVFRTVEDMKIVSRRYDRDAVIIELTRQAGDPGSNDAGEPWPSGRMTKQQAPGLHR